jgi:hypothetical protein
MVVVMVAVPVGGSGAGGLRDEAELVIDWG